MTQGRRFHYKDFPAKTSTYLKSDLGHEIASSPPTGGSSQ
jgi:hypothetical protein